MCVAVAVIWDRVRGKMRFWGKTKYGEKKTSREKLICGGDSLDGDYGDTGPLLGEGAFKQKAKKKQKKKRLLFRCHSAETDEVSSPVSPQEPGRRTRHRPAAPI